MTGWKSIVGHVEVLGYLQSILVSGRIASAFLFCGPEGIGKRTVARVFAQTLLCEGGGSPRTTPCGECPACCQVAASSHPDLILVQRPADKAFIPIEAFIGADGKMREGLCHDLSLKPFRGGRRIAIVDDADFMHQEGANSLLKTLEEPPPGSVLILLGTSPARQLPTIRSRCQRVLFQPLGVGQVEEVLGRLAAVEDPTAIRRLAGASGGSVQRALELRDPAVLEFRDTWLRQLASGDPAAEMFPKSLSTFIDQAGNDAAAKRDRMRLVSGWALEFFEQALRSSAEDEFVAADPTIQQSLESMRERHGPAAPTVARCLERCLEAHQDVATNVNQGLWIDCLLTDLAKLALGEFVDTRYT